MAEHDEAPGLGKALADLRAALTPMTEAPANVNATSALPDDLRESVAVANIKTIGEAAAYYTAMHMGNLTAHAKRVDTLAETAMARSIDLINNLGPAEARAASKVLTGNDTADQILQLITALQGALSAKGTVAKPE